MNKLEKLLDAIGLKIETEYLLIRNGQPVGTKYKIDKEGNFLFRSTNNKWVVSSKDFLKCIGNKNDEFVELPYRPNHGKDYWYVEVNGDCYDRGFNMTYIKDLLNLAIGNCFKTKEDAEKSADKYVKIFEDIRSGKTLLVSEAQNKDE